MVSVVVFGSCFEWLIVLALGGFWIWMLVDCALNEPSEGNDKLVWVLIILFASVLGAAIYFVARRPNRLARRPNRLARARRRRVRRASG